MRSGEAMPGLTGACSDGFDLFLTNACPFCHAVMPDFCRSLAMTTALDGKRTWVTRNAEGGGLVARVDRSSDFPVNELGEDSAAEVSRRIGRWLRFVLGLFLFFWGAGIGAQTFTFEGGVIAGGGGVSTNAKFSISGVVGEFSALSASGGGFTVDGGFLNAESPSRVPAAPALLVSRLGNTVRISWASDAGAFLLQETSNVIGTPWSDSAVTPSLINGQWVVALGATSSARFFRLSSSPPVLSVKRTGATLEVSWSATASGYVLQETVNLGGAGSWSDVTAVASLVRGRWVVALPSQTGARFLRLRRP